MNVLFISYTGVLEPLGQSQVVPYVIGLARRGHAMKILSFEKEAERSPAWMAAQERLDREGIAWTALRYHKRPPVASTLWDVATAVLASRSDVDAVELVHARAHVPALVAEWWRVRRKTPFLFDHRGRMADEFADAGVWRRDGVLYRSTERWEQRFIRQAAHTVVLTDRLRAELPVPSDRVSVIPCAVDLRRFQPAPAGSGADFDLVHSGSWSGLYLKDETLRFFAAWRRLRPRARLLVLAAGGGSASSVEAVEVRSVDPDEVPPRLLSARAGLSLRRPGRAQTAASPVKVSEYWACGLPVVTTAGVGDLDDLIRQHRVGVVLRGLTDEDLEAGARELADLLEEGEDLRRRCRALAEQRYDLERAIEAYDAAYRAAVGRRDITTNGSRMRSDDRRA